ncbi:MAG: DNA methylase [Nitrososphaerota archaeon]|jgi:DNA modification methylase|nr:DNA methylase [Nitrososphaerota archaeon]MDG6949947.1 DNA methylase [Nitrososphaerota archaeon]
MELVSPPDYRDYLAHHYKVPIGGSEITLRKNWNISQYGPNHYQPEEWTVWSFPDRGNWATHGGDYPGNWSPFIPRNLLDRYTKVGETVCDPTVGSGTTLVESKLMGRNAIGVDLNPDACMIAMNRLDFDFSNPRQIETPRIDVYCGDARNLDAIRGESLELVVLHPPYAGLIRYSEGNPGDLSHLGIKEFVHEIGFVAKECLRILKQNRHCAVLVGDTRLRGHYVPLSIGVLSAFLAAGFVLKEDIIKIQHQTRSARERWTDRSYGFYKIAHEHLYVLRRPVSGERMVDFENSLLWW